VLFVFCLVRALARAELAELRARFEEDRQRILKLKETRAFRPY